MESWTAEETRVGSLAVVRYERIVDQRFDLGLVTLLASNEQGPPGENIALTPASSCGLLHNERTF